MGKKKKNRTAIDKRRLKSKQRKKERRKRVKVKNPSGGENLRLPEPDIMMAPRPSLADMDAPEGFRSIGLSQAMVEFSRPLMDAVEEVPGIDMNEVLELGMVVWNYEIALAQDGGSTGMKMEIVRQLQRVLGLDLQEAIDRLDQLVARKRFLFPANIKSPSPMTMFMRKETSHLIPEFNYQALKLSDKPIPADEADRNLVANLQQLECKVDDRVDYGEWEAEFFDLKDLCCKQFCKWLQQKGAGEEYCQEFPSCLDMYLDFVYGYMHFGSVTLQNMPADKIDEFFSDYLLRKVIVEPHEYTFWPPALKLFYRFLSEKEYLANAGRITKLLDKFEPRFLYLLRERYA